MFEFFIEELKKYDVGVNRLYPPASEESIKCAEEMLGFRLPEDYRVFLRRWNGGLLFAKEFGDLVLWSVEDERLEGVREYNWDLVRDNKFLINEQKHPEHLLVMAIYSDGSLACLDLRNAGHVVLWNRDERQVELEWDTLEAWLNSEMEQGAELYDYHGDEIETGSSSSDIRSEDIKPRLFSDPHGD
ncbi:MAG: SMI1/KNR4 family protein [Phycisphaerae bacterium]|nr:SMI1/KNR4 family protein [Phycisphaerae bacterium]